MRIKHCRKDQKLPQLVCKKRSKHQKINNLLSSTVEKIKISELQSDSASWFANELVCTL